MVEGVTRSVDRPGVVFLLCCASLMGLSLFMNVIAVFLTTLSHAFGGVQGLTGEQLGRIAVFSFAGIIAGIVTGGSLAGRLDSKAFMVGGNGLIALGMFFCSLSRTYGAFLGSMFVVGAGCGLLDLILTPVTVSLYPRRKAAVLNWLHAFYSIGGILTILFCGFALSRHWGWRTVVAALAVFPLLTAAGLLFCRLPPLLKDEDGRQRARDIVHKPVFLFLAVALLLAGIPEIGINVWLPAYSELELGLPIWQANLGLVLFTAAMAAGRLLNGWLSRGIPVLKLMFAGCILVAACYLAASLLKSPDLAWLSCVVIGLGVSSLWPGTLSLVSERFPRAGVSVYALLSVVANIGGILTPWLIGLGGDLIGLRTSMALVAVFPAAMILLLWRLPGAGSAKPLA